MRVLKGGIQEFTLNVYNFACIEEGECFIMAVASEYASGHEKISAQTPYHVWRRINQAPDGSNAYCLSSGKGYYVMPNAKVIPIRVL